MSQNHASMVVRTGAPNQLAAPRGRSAGRRTPRAHDDQGILFQFPPIEWAGLSGGGDLRADNDDHLASYEDDGDGIPEQMSVSSERTDSDGGVEIQPQQSSPNAITPLLASPFSVILPPGTMPPCNRVQDGHQMHLIDYFYPDLLDPPVYHGHTKQELVSFLGACESAFVEIERDNQYYLTGQTLSIRLHMLSDQCKVKWATQFIVGRPLKVIHEFEAAGGRLIVDWIFFRDILCDEMYGRIQVEQKLFIARAQWFVVHQEAGQTVKEYLEELERLETAFGGIEDEGLKRDRFVDGLLLHFQEKIWDDVIPETRMEVSEIVTDLETSLATSSEFDG